MTQVQDSETTVRVVELEDADFDWFLSGATEPRNGLSLPPGEFQAVETLRYLRSLTKRLHAVGCRAAWMVVAGGEAVGMIGHKDLPTVDGMVEIGYGMAASRRGRGYATKAVGVVLEAARRDPTILCVTAQTVIDNLASQRVLQKNGFARNGERIDSEDGLLIQWSADVRTC